MPTYSQAPVDSYLAFLEEITEYEEKSIEEISAQAATINDEEMQLPSYLSSPDKSDHENDLSEGDHPYVMYLIACRGHTIVSFSSCHRNLIKTFQIEGMIALITKMNLIFL